jgi:4-hydroxy-3-polyprenylbenzoate decarboxylase
MGQKLVIGITGASGTILGVRLLELLQGTDVEAHLVISKWGARTLMHETPYTLDQVKAMAAQSYSINDQGAAISSGSYLTNGMIVVPCSMRTLASIANGQSDNLIHRAADVILKERRRLILVVRESPLNEIHLRNMLALSRMGVTILPPIPGFYNHPRSLEEMVDHMVMRILDQLAVHLDVTSRWDGRMAKPG